MKYFVSGGGWKHALILSRIMQLLWFVIFFLALSVSLYVSVWDVDGYQNAQTLSFAFELEMQLIIIFIIHK